MLCLSSITFVSFHHFFLFVNPSPSADDPVLAEEPVTAFAMIFRPQFWWFEIYNMLRRLMLTCAVLLCADLAETVVFVMLVAVVTLVIEQESKAYVNQFLSSFTAVCCWQVLLFIHFLLLVGPRERPPPPHHHHHDVNLPTTTTTTITLLVPPLPPPPLPPPPSWTRSLPVAARPSCSRCCSAWQT